MLASASLWLSWNFEPVVVLILAAVCAAYFYALGPLRRRYKLADSVDRGKAAFFVTAIVLIAVALLSPLHTLGTYYLLTAHMVQHMLLTVVAPPLLLLGIPGWMVAPLFQGARVRAVGRLLTHPVVAFGLYNANMWLWHVPALFDADAPLAAVRAMQFIDVAVVVGLLAIGALVLLPRLGGRTSGPTASILGSPVTSALAILALVVVTVTGPLNVQNWGPAFQPHNPLHLLMSAMFLGTAILYWCPILSPIPELLPRLSLGAGMLYMFISTQPMMALGALLTFAPQPFYTRYAGAPLLFGFTRLGDQQFAGLTMWLPMDAPLLLALSILFFRWVNQRDLEERIAAGELDATEPAATAAADAAVPSGSPGS
jgi:cytochrome c oxidase assembly factor CtaG